VVVKRAGWTRRSAALLVAGSIVSVSSCNQIVGNEDVTLGASSGSGGSGAKAGASGSGGGGLGGAGGSGGAPSGGGAGTSGSAGSVAKLVECSGNQCTVGSAFCCATTGFSQCWTLGTQCNGLEVRCDGPEDCDTAELCCGTTGDGGTALVRTECQPGCTAKQIVVCGSTPTACLSPTTCQASSDHPDYKLCL
jgi:hypothetical protein